MALLSCAVQYDAHIKNNYYLKYKGLYLKYQKCTKDSESDVLTAFYTDEEENEVYKRVMEFAYAYAYYRDYECLISSGYLQNDVLDFHSMAEYSGGFVVNRKLYMEIEEYPWDLPPITLISSEDQVNLLHLYMRANSNQDPIFKCLFFLHTIVCPEKDDKTAISYINNCIEKNLIPDYSKDLLTYLLTSSAFGDVKNNDFGKHVKNIRNSIVHVIRSFQDNINLQLDNTEQNVYLVKLARILKEIAKYKLDTEYNFCKLADKSIISSYDPIGYK